jgi:geranylgeranyl diphosphate synthase type II
VTADLWPRLAERQRAIEDALASTLAQFTPDALSRLVEAMRYSLLGGGKRLRPILSILACEAAGGTLQQALPAACALEMVHTYSLIHDDLPAMDDDDVRRGQPTCHKQFDEATAILAGDALLTLAFEVLAAGCPPRTAAVSCAELARGAGAIGMVGGQILDILASGTRGRAEIAADWAPSRGPLAELEEIHTRKTGALFRASLRLGIYAAQAEKGVNPETLAAVDAYSEAFGLAFQVTDDLLDVTGTAEKAGKKVGKDADRGKLTYPGLLGIDASRVKAHALGEKAVCSAKLLGPAGKLLADLAEYVVTRDR